MATKSQRHQLDPVQKRRVARQRLAFVGMCAGLDRRPHWSFDNVAREEPRGRFPWEGVQEAVFAAIDHDAEWANIEAFYEELKAEARERHEARQRNQEELRHTGAFQCVVKESAEAVSAATHAYFDRSESAIDRAIKECRDALRAFETFIASLFRRREQIAARAAAGLRAL